MIFCAILLSFVCSASPLCERFKIQDKYFMLNPSENSDDCITTVLNIEIPTNLQSLPEVNKICELPNNFDSSHDCLIKLTDGLEIYFYYKCILANHYFNVKNNVLEKDILCEETGDNYYDINYFCQITELQLSFIEDDDSNCNKRTFNNNHYFSGECVLNRPYFSINGDSTSEHLSCESNRNNIFDIKKFCTLTKSTSTSPAILFLENGECNTFIEDEINYYGKCSLEKPFFYKKGEVLDDFIQCEETETAHNLIKACEIPKSSEIFTVDKSKCSSKDKYGKYFSEKCTNTDSNASGNLIRCDKGDLLYRFDNCDNNLTSNCQNVKFDDIDFIKENCNLQTKNGFKFKKGNELVDSFVITDFSSCDNIKIYNDNRNDDEEIGEESGDVTSVGLTAIAILYVGLL